jgi:hypothetical protein
MAVEVVEWFTNVTNVARSGVQIQNVPDLENQVLLLQMVLVKVAEKESIKNYKATFLERIFIKWHQSMGQESVVLPVNCGEEQEVLIQAKDLWKFHLKN